LRSRLGGCCLALTAILILTAACGGGDDGDDASPTTSAVATREPLPTAVVADNTVTSTAWEYKAAVPENWTVSSNFVQSGTASASDDPRYGGDALFAPEAQNTDPAKPVRANIAIVCEETDSTDLDAFVAQKVDLLTSLRRENVVVTDYADVAGHPAKKIEYDLAREELSFEKAEVYFLTPRCARSIALTAQPGDRARLLPELDRVAQSFEVEE
jgi:hypothetical protein